MLFMITLTGCSTFDESDLTIVLIAGIDTVEVHTSYTDPGALSKAYGFTISNEVIYNDVDITQVGTYSIIYQVDYRNATKTITRIVTVIDETPPSVMLNPGVDTIHVGDTWVDASVTATDNSLVDVTIERVGTVNTNIKGDYFISYLVTDSSGNQTEMIRYVFVIE